MSERTTTYALEAAAAAGFAVMHIRVAAMLRPDLYPHGNACRDFSQNITLPGAKAMKVKLDGLGEPVPVLTRSTRRLAERIEEVTGISAFVIGEMVAAPPQALPKGDPLAAEARRRNEDKLAKLRELAAQDLPSHDCSLRHEILAARTELARLDPERQAAGA
jgi:hypothetical protein